MPVFADSGARNMAQYLGNIAIKNRLHELEAKFAPCSRLAPQDETSRGAEDYITRRKFRRTRARLIMVELRVFAPTTPIYAAAAT